MAAPDEFEEHAIPDTNVMRDQAVAWLNEPQRCVCARARARVCVDQSAHTSTLPLKCAPFAAVSSLFALVFSFFVSPRAHYDEMTGDM